MQNAWAIGTSDVMKWFEQIALMPYYSIWSGRQIVFSWPEDDMGKGKDILENNLRAFEDQGITDLFVLKLHPALDKSGYITDKSPVTGSLNFRPSPQFIQSQMGGPELSFPRNAGMQHLADEIRSLRAERDAMNDDSLVSEDAGVLGTINKILSIPGVTEAVQPLIMGLTSGLMKSMGMPLPDPAAVPAVPLQPAAMAGISPDQDDKINQALDILEPMAPELGDDLLRLAALAQRDPAQFQMLLNMLKSNG